jgi:deazaflavin-dependent oxidoreductase (nitroreductase family)
MAQTPDGPRLTHIQQEPGKLLWAINRVPTWIFKLRLGRLFGSRFAMITHTGRKSGKPHTVIVETAAGSVESGRLVYIVAYGSRAQWYKNLQNAPAVSIEIAGKIYDAPRHEFLGRGDTEQAIASYWEKYPRLGGFLARHGGFLLPWPGRRPPLRAQVDRFLPRLARGPFEMANAAAGVDERSAGRLVLGIGPGAFDFLEGFSSTDGTNPRARMSEYIDVLRVAWDYLRDFDPACRYSGEHFRFEPPPFNPWGVWKMDRTRIPIFLAGLRSRIMQLAGAAECWAPARPCSTR